MGEILLYYSGCSAVGSAPHLGCGCRVFESRHSDHKPHYKAIYGSCNAVLILCSNISLPHLQSYHFGSFEERPVFSVVFFVYCGSIFENIATESCIGDQLSFYEMRYASVYPFMRYSTKWGALVLKGSVIRSLNNSGINCPQVWTIQFRRNGSFEMPLPRVSRSGAVFFGYFVPNFERTQ